MHKDSLCVRSRAECLDHAVLSLGQNCVLVLGTCAVVFLLAWSRRCLQLAACVRWWRLRGTPLDVLRDSLTNRSFSDGETSDNISLPERNQAASDASTQDSFEANRSDSHSGISDLNNFERWYGPRQEPPICEDEHRELHEKYGGVLVHVFYTGNQFQAVVRLGPLEVARSERPLHDRQADELGFFSAHYGLLRATPEEALSDALLKAALWHREAEELVCRSVEIEP